MSLKASGYLSPGALVFTATLVGILLAEALLRLVLPSSTGFFVYEPGFERMFYPDPRIFPGVEGLSRFQINSRGVRADEIEPSDTYCIMALGGSTTECLFLDQKEQWPYLIQQSLNDRRSNHRIWVGNFGKTGVNTREHRYQLPRLLEDFPEVDCILFLVGVNDVLLRLAREARYDPYYVLKPENRNELLYRAFAITPDWLGHPNSILRRMRIWGLFKRAFTQLDRARRDLPPIYAEDDAGEVYVERRKLRQEARSIRTEGPDLATGLEEYERNLNACIDQAVARSIRVVLVTQPVLWKENLSEDLQALLWTGGVYSIFGENLDYYSVEVLASAMDAYNQKLVEVAAKRNLELVDLAPMLPRDTTIFYDDCHFNENGARVVAGILAKYLLDHEPFRSDP